MSVENAIRQVENISQGLIEVLPECENQINKNKAEYISRLKELLSESEQVKSCVQGKRCV
jgi:ABC-type Zn uptake system ZnuABC Zn-binding protein ZnuA